MSRWNKGLLVAIAALLAAVLVILVHPRIGAAQSTGAGADASISRGPGGMWIVRGNRIYICDLDPVRPATVEPPTPRCGTPLTLR